MNPINSITYNLKGLAAAYKKIAGPDTRKRADEMILSAVRELIPPSEPTVTMTTTITPSTEPESTPTSVPAEVVMLDGWPMRAEVSITGLFPNRRKLRGTLADGRVVAVERKPGVQSGSVVQAKIVLGGRPPLYRAV